MVAGDGSGGLGGHEASGFDGYGPPITWEVMEEEDKGTPGFSPSHQRNFSIPKTVAKV